MNLSKLDGFALVSMIAGIGGTGALSAFGDSIETLAPGFGKKAVALLSIVSFAAGLVIRTLHANQNIASAAVTAAPSTPTPPASPEGTNP